jgi:hypothetical protein
MKERPFEFRKFKPKENPLIGLPPAWCGGICKNAMGEICCEGCALKRDMSAFELKKGVELPDLPPFPLDDFLHTMTADERKTIMAVYMAKTVDFIQGRKVLHNDYPSNFPGRPLPHPSGHHGDPQSKPSESVPSDSRNEVREDREEHSSTDVGFSEMAEREE